MIDVSSGSRKRVSSVICMSARPIVTSVLWFCVLPISLLVMISGCLCKFTWWLIYSCADLCWLLWTRLYGSVVRAVDCRSAGPWFNSGWKSWFTFMTWSSSQIIQMINIMSPITTSIRTITRNSVKIFFCDFFCVVFTVFFAFFFRFFACFLRFFFFFCVFFCVCFACFFFFVFFFCVVFRFCFAFFAFLRSCARAFMRSCVFWVFFFWGGEEEGLLGFFWVFFCLFFLFYWREGVCFFWGGFGFFWVFGFLGFWVLVVGFWLCLCLCLCHHAHSKCPSVLSLIKCSLFLSVTHDVGSSSSALQTSNHLHIHGPIVSLTVVRQISFHTFFQTWWRSVASHVGLPMCSFL